MKDWYTTELTGGPEEEEEEEERAGWCWTGGEELKAGWVWLRRRG